MIDEALAGGGFRSAFAQSMHEEMGNSAPVELQMPSPAPSTPEGTLQFLRKAIFISVLFRDICRKSILFQEKEKSEGEDERKFDPSIG
ncbi:hypothetical protein TKK_0000475 [Trichogramma kaykai]